MTEEVMSEGEVKAWEEAMIAVRTLIGPLGLINWAIGSEDLSMVHRNFKEQDFDNACKKVLALLEYHQEDSDDPKL